MAYNYPYGEHGHYATTPTTPTTYASPWDEQGPQAPQEQSATIDTQPQIYHQPPQTVQLEESVPVAPSQPRYGGYSPETSGSHARSAYAADVASDNARTRLGLDTTRPRTASTLPVRTSPSRSHATQASHPYSRPGSSHAQGGASGRATARRLTDDLKNLAVGLTPGSTTTVGCPAQARRSKAVPSGSRAVSSPLASTSQTGENQPPHQQESMIPAKQWNIRTDVHFNAQNNTMTALFEIPGVKKSDLTITLARCPYSRVKQITVTGRAKSILADDAVANGFFTTRERFQGEFKRTLVVPYGAEASDIRAEMQDGILVLKVPGGELAEPFAPITIEIP